MRKDGIPLGLEGGEVEVEAVCSKCLICLSLPSTATLFTVSTTDLYGTPSESCIEGGGKEQSRAVL